MILANYYNLTQAVLASLLLIMYVTTLVRVCRGRKFSFVVKLILLLMFSNIAMISASISNYEVLLKEKTNDETEKTNDETTLYLWIASISFATRDATFNVAHWMFAFEYYSISRYMPFLLMKARPRISMVRCDELIYKLFLILNIFAPIMNGASLLIYNLCDIKFESPNSMTD